MASSSGKLLSVRTLISSVCSSDFIGQFFAAERHLNISKGYVWPDRLEKLANQPTNWQRGRTFDTAVAPRKHGGPTNSPDKSGQAVHAK